MSKCIKRCAFIRSDKGGVKSCPFGLPITLACENAGSSVTHMAPLEAVSEDQRERVGKANKRVYIYQKTDSRCLYAANIIKSHDSVNCDYGDTGAGMHMPAISGSPLYAQTFAGLGIDGLYAFPLGMYSDNGASRNMFHGLFSLVGEMAPQIVKQAIVEGNEELWSKIENNEVLLPEEQSELNIILDQCRMDFEQYRNDPEKINELVEKWNSRKNL